MIGTPLGPSEFSDWFPKFRDLVELFTRDMDDLLGDQFDLDKPALAVELADTAWRWALTQTPQPAAPEGGENAAPHDGGSTPPSGGLGPCVCEECVHPTCCACGKPNPYLTTPPAQPDGEASA